MIMMKSRFDGWWTEHKAKHMWKMARGCIVNGIASSKMMRTEFCSLSCYHIMSIALIAPGHLSIVWKEGGFLFPSIQVVFWYCKLHSIWVCCFSVAKVVWFWGVRECLDWVVYILIKYPVLLLRNVRRKNIYV